MQQQWFWCLEHQRPEPEGQACAQDKRLGPYESREAARNWKQLHEQREERWEEQEKAWEDGDGDDANGQAGTDTEE